ncbi:hypothetical protein C0993_011914 [Termitomyces sp. T159_Od127]|nr:hypothetical protein C0993_011914 [Termitomyces sp. T159_Od127]
MGRTRISPPERQRRPSDAHKARKKTTAFPKRDSGSFTRTHTSKSLRNSRGTEKPAQRTFSPDHWQKFDPDDPTFCNSDPEVPQSDDDEQGSEDNENSLFHWESESTLFGDLLDASASEPEDDKYDELVNSLQPAFNDGGRELKREIADKLVPTVNRIKDLYRQIDSKVDDSFAKGIITFNNGCKELEILAMRDEDDIKDALTQFKVKTDELLYQLTGAYAARNKIWADFEQAIQANVEPTLEMLRDLPASIERSIGNLEKEARTLEKEDINVLSAVEKKIQKLLAKA